MDEIMVSICCLTYNHEEYIKNAIDGFLMQKTNFKYEILIHDDASTDKTADIIREYEVKYPEIVFPIYQTENQYSRGIKITPTYQFSRARGKYIAMCEGDDYWNDDKKLQRQFDILEKNEEMALCVHDSNTEDMINGICKRIASYKEDCILGFDMFLEDYYKRMPKPLFQTSSFFFRAKYINNMPQDISTFFRECPVGDIPLLLYLGSCGKIYYCKDSMSVYRYGRPGSWTVSKKNIAFTEKMRDSYKTFNEYTEYRYAKQIDKIIDSLEFSIYFQKEQYTKMLQRKYWPFFKKLVYKSKIYVVLGAFSPSLLTLIKKKKDV